MQTSVRLLLLLLLVVDITGAQARTQTVTSIAATPPSPRLAQTVTLTASVTPAEASGKVTFYDGTDILGSATLSNGGASLVTVGIGSGKRSLTALYSGDSNYGPSLSAALAITVVAQPGGGWVPAANANVSPDAIPAALADLNHDGNLDLVGLITNANDSSGPIAAVFLGNGDGTFQAPTVYLSDHKAAGVAVADIDMDGNPDLVVTSNGASPAGTGALTTLIGNGDGTFRTGSTVLSAGDLSIVRIADVNGDGRPDLVLLRGGLPGVEILLGNGDGTFQTNSPINITLKGYQYDVVVADFNGDGIPDMAAASPDDNTVSVMIGVGRGTFAPPVLYTSYGAQYLTAGDVNEDGRPDLLVGNVSAGSFDLLVGNGDGTFAPARTVATNVEQIPYGPSYLTTYDFDGDSHPDVVAVNQFAISVLPGNGDGTFRTPLDFSLLGFAPPAVYGDLNHDGIIDVVTGTPGSHSYLGKLAPEFAVSATPNPAQAGQTFTVTVTSSEPDATGTISLRSFLPDAGTATLVNGVATYTFQNIATGIYNFDGTYSGDAKYAATVLPTIVVQVQHAATATLSVSPNPALPGQVVTLSASVTPVHGLASFYDGSTPLCQQTSYQPTAMCETILAAGRHLLSVRFPGGGGVLPASAEVIEDVRAIPNGQLQDGPILNAISTPSATLVGDLDGDGFLDLAALDTGARQVTIYSGKGQDSFQPPSQNVLAFVPGAIVAGVFDGYGNTDLAVTDPADNAVAILQYYNKGNYTPRFSLSVGKQPLAIAAADFNGDGDTDIVTANAGSDDVSLLLTSGYPAAFQHPVTLPAGRHPDAVVVADFNGDGKADFAVANRDDNTVMVFLGNGDGTFQTPVTTPSGTAPITALAGDLNGDGKIDLVTVDSGTNTLTILLGNGDGTFRTAATYSTGSVPSSAVMVDLNGDDELDLAVTTATGLLVFTSDGDGTFSVPTIYPQYANAASVSCGAFAGDGRMELVMSLPNSGTVALTVNGISTATELSATPASTAMGEKVTLTATVSPAVSAGAVSFYDGITPIGASPISNGSGSFSTTLLFAGTHSLSARFTGGSGYGASASGPVSLQISPVPSAGLLAPSRQSSLSGTPLNLIPGDFNKDGIEDFAFLTEGSGLGVILGNSDGTFRSPAASTFAAVGQSAVTADFNDDGNTDIVSTANSAYIDLGDGTGNFNYTGFGRSATAVAVADFNGDGRPDIVRVDPSVPTAYVELGVGDGSFQLARSLSAGASPILVATGDFNGDGKPDFVVANALPPPYFGGAATGELDVLLGNGDGTFAPARKAAMAAQAVSMIVGDFNGDGRPDIAMVHGGSNMLSVLLGNGEGDFTAPATFQLGAPPAQLLAADMDGDGRTDLVVMFTSASPAFAVLNGGGDGTFGSPVNYPDVSAPSAMAVGDVNGDGRMDVVLAEGDTVRIFSRAAGSLSFAQGASQTTAVGTSFPVAFGVNAPAGAQVTFIAPGANANPPSAGGSFPGGAASVTVTAAANGVATAPQFTANTTPGSYSVVAWAAGVAGILSFSLANNPGPPASMNALGNARSVIINNWSFPGLQVFVQDTYGNGIPGVTVQFTAPATGASCAFESAGAEVTAVTNSMGIASSPAFQANAIAGSYSVVAAAAGTTFTVSFPVTNQPAPSLSIVSGANQSAVLNGAFGAPLLVRLIDSSGHPVQFSTVTFTAPASGASALFAASGASSIVAGTDQFGIASTDSLSAAGATGSYVVTAASVSYGGSVAFPLTNTANPPGQPQPQSISFPPIPSHFANDPPFALTATASSGLPVSFSVVSGPATITGSRLSITGSGFVSVQAAQAGNSSFSAALAVIQGFVVSPVSPVLTVTKSHVGSFAQNQSGVTYTITVGNAANAGPTSQMVTIGENPPAGLTVTSMSGGTTWHCVVHDCSTSVVLGAGATYPNITVTANVAGDAPATLTNQVTMWYGTATTGTASDPTTIVPFSCAISGDQAPSGADVQMILKEALGSAQAAHFLAHNTAITVVDVEKLINAALDHGCPY